MKIEQQVCSLEQAKRLCEFEIGIDYEPVFAWVPPFPIFNESLKLVTVKEFKYHLENSILSDEAKGIVNYYPAFTVAELGVMLPDEYLRSDIDKENYHGYGRELWNTGHGWGWRIKYTPECKFCDTEAEARAGMLIYLLEKNLITVDEVNKRLNQ